MSKTQLTISGLDGTRQVAVNPAGTLLGRDADCDIVLNDKGVSRRHARLYQDLFGRWIIEDLGSHNGVLVEGRRVKAQALRPSQTINIARFNLALLDEINPTTDTDILIEDLINVVDKGDSENIVNYSGVQSEILSSDLMQKLNELTNSLLQVSNPADLYRQACFQLAAMYNTLAMVVRISPDSESSSVSSDILACRFGTGTIEDNVLQKANLYLSRRVLEAVHSTDNPVMATSTATNHMQLTVVDENSPHVVFAARVNETADSIDILYMDLLEENCPEKMFDFFEATARQINLIQKKLFFEELQKKELALRQANIELKEKDRIKDEYVSRVTHDIKGHLYSIKICLDVVNNDINSLKQQQAEFLNRAYQRTNRLSDFVIELLNLTKMRLDGQLQANPFSLTQVVLSAIETVSRKAKDKSIALTSDIAISDEQIVGDEFSINEMITNLLFNSIKYTPEKKSVHIAMKEVDGAFKIEISDEGIGIPENEIDNIFDEFFRASNAKSYEKDGTGLGLSIVKQIIKRHGGNISAQSQVGQGTTFTITLPRNGIL